MFIFFFYYYIIRGGLGSTSLQIYISYIDLIDDRIDHTNLSRLP